MYNHGKDSNIADTLSRITTKDLKDVNRKVNNTIEINCANEQKYNKGPNKEPKVYNVINNNDAKKCMQIKFGWHLCSNTHGRKITVKFKISDMYTNRKLDLGQSFQTLETEVGILGKSRIKISPSGNIFKFVSQNQFKIKDRSSATLKDDNNGQLL